MAWFGFDTRLIILQERRIPRGEKQGGAEGEEGAARGKEIVPEKNSFTASENQPSDKVGARGKKCHACKPRKHGPLKIFSRLKVQPPSSL